MLDQLRCEDAVEFAGSLKRRIREEVGYLGIESFVPAHRDGLGAEIDAFGRNAHLVHQLQKLAAAAADIEHAAAIGKERAVELFGLTNLRFRTAETKSETGVVDIERPRGLRGMGGGVVRRGGGRRGL